MSEVIKLKCQFCSLDFTSAYKIIPHIYFGHRKKLCRQVRDRGEILLKSPFPDHQFEVRVAIDAGSSPEEVYSKAAEMFNVLEDHILSVTGEEKLTKCPYCNIDLSTLPHPYWVHLEEHMNMNNSSPSTPAKTTSTTPASSSSDTPTTTHVGASPTLKTASPGKVDVTASVSPVKEQTEVCNAEPETKHEPAVAGIEPISKGRVTRSKQNRQEQIKKQLLEIEQKIALKKKEEDEKKRMQEEEAEKQRQQEEEEKEKEKREEAARLQKIEDDLQRQKEEEQLQQEIERQMAEELAQREKAEAKKKKEEEERRRKQEELIRQREAELQRLKEQEEIERQRLKELERKRKDEEERRRMEEEQRRQKEADLKRQVDEQMRLLKQAEESKLLKKDPDHLHGSRWDREESSNTVSKSPVDMVPLRSPATEMMMKSPVERPRSDDKMDRSSSGRQTPVSRTRSREVSGELDRLDRDPRRRRSTSGDKKHSSVWRKDREAAWEKPDAAQVSPDQNSKPVLTEEMERSIIYGNFKKKEKTREDKLVDVKKEIEARFKAEEERRKRILEEKRKAEEKEREKQRLAEEKLKKEKEKLREEKRKTKLKLEELRLKERDLEPEPEEEPSIEDDELIEKESEEMDEQPPSPKRTRDKSPDQYEKIKMEIKKIDREIEKKQEARKNVQSSEEIRSNSISPEPEPEIHETRTVSLLPAESDTGRNVLRSVVAYQVEDEEDDEDDEEDELEAMMRDFQERESQKPPEPNYVSESNQAVSPKLPSTSDADKEDDPVSSSVTSFEIKCPLWKDLMGKGQSYESSYDFLADVYLHQRKKIISRSRKARKMELTCPANSGFSTAISDDGVSIDYFTSELPVHLAALCDHLRSCYTGEDRRPGDHTRASFWQLLANHRDSRRVHCPSCNTFPFKNSGCRCSEQTDKSGKSLEELARDVETGLLKSEDLRPQKHTSNDLDVEIETERLMRASEKRLEREKEERQIVIPRLPRMFGPEEVRTPASWKYHVMADKYGEVWCPETQSCILGYKYLEGLVDGFDDQRVKVVRYRGDTWLDIDQRKVKVFYDYEGLETVARVAYNNNTLSGTGDNHEQATRNLQQEVKRHLEKLKVKFDYFLLPFLGNVLGF